MSSLMTVVALVGGGVTLVGEGLRMERNHRRAARAAYEPLDPEGPAMPLQRYKLRIYDGQYEVLHRNNFVVDVDLDSPSAGPILNTQFAALIEIAKHSREPMEHPRMTIHHHATDAYVQDWVG